jgi:hypothetical protein
MVSCQLSVASCLLESCPELTRICTDETNLGKGKPKSNDEIQGSFTPFRMTTQNKSGRMTI